jgi:pyruvate dehydrogenase E1 component alpha subunit
MEISGGKSLTLEKGKLIEIYRKMLEIRNFEEKVFELFGQNLIPGTIHLYTGEEAVAVGVCTNLRKDDYIRALIAVMATVSRKGHG